MTDITIENYTDYKRKTRFIELYNAAYHNNLTGSIINIIFNYVGSVVNILLLDKIPENMFAHWTLFKSIRTQTANNIDLFLTMGIKYRDCFDKTNILYYKLPTYKMRHNVLCDYLVRRSHLYITKSSYLKLLDIVNVLKDVMVAKMSGPIDFNITNCKDGQYKNLDNSERENLLHLFKKAKNLNIEDRKYHTIDMLGNDKRLTNENKTLRITIHKENKISPPTIFTTGDLSINDVLKCYHMYSKYSHNYLVTPVIYIKNIQAILDESAEEYNFHATLGVKELHIEYPEKKITKKHFDIIDCEF